MKKIIRLTESDLKKIVKESVKKIIKESNNDFDAAYCDNEEPYYGEENQQKKQMLINQLLQLGLRDVTNVYKSDGSGYGSENDGEYGVVPSEIAKQFLSARGEKLLMKRGFVIQWFIEFEDRTFCSRHNFNSEEEAQKNCDKYIDLITKAGFDCGAYVDGISFENGKYIMDTCLVYEDYGDGQPFWMD